jgi:dephospho-CoA kinase
MKRIGLTGSIGSGKSTVAQVFEILGVPVYHADKQAREMLRSGEVIKQIARLFGKNVLNSRHQVDRKALAAIVFNDKDKLDSLNNLIHPLIEEDFSRWCELHRGSNFILHEAAILFESGFNRLFDATILVTAPEELCISRVMTRDSVSKENVENRLSNQWPQEKKQELADYLVINDEITMIIPQVLAIYQEIKNKFQVPKEKKENIGF